MKEFAIGIRVHGSKYLTYIRIQGDEIKQVNNFTVLVDDKRIEFGEVIETIRTEDLS